MRNWSLIGAALLVALALAIYATGALLPQAHVARLEGRVTRPPADIARQIRDVRAYPSWRRGVAVDAVVQEADAVTYVETTGEDRIAYRLVEAAPDARFVATLTDPALPFGGAWTITLAPDGTGTRVRIEENGEIRDPLYRFFARFVFGYTSSMATYLKDLGATEIAPPPT